MMAAKAPRLLVFDCDGTLVDSQHSIVAAMHAACEARGFAKPTPEAIRRIVGLSLLEAISRLIPDATSDDCQDLRESYSQSFFAMRQNGGLDEPLYPGVKQGLEEMERDGWLLGVATGKSHRGLVATLAGHGLSERFVTLQTADRAVGKPNPEMLFKAMDEVGADPCSTIMIGDTTYDIEMARNAGVSAIGVAWGYHDPDELKSVGAQAVVGSFDSLTKVVRELEEDAR